MYNIALRYICVTIVAMEKQQVIHILSVSVALVIQHVQCMSHVI
jgi:hypothetical protein